MKTSQKSLPLTVAVRYLSWIWAMGMGKFAWETWIQSWCWHLVPGQSTILAFFSQIPLPPGHHPSGLHQWQYAFISYDISPQTKQWLSMYKSITYNTSLLIDEPDAFVNKQDPNQVFKTKNRILIPQNKRIWAASVQKRPGPLALPTFLQL